MTDAVKIDEARLRELAEAKDEAIARVRDLADAIEAHLLGSPGNFEIAVSYLEETERDLRTVLYDLSAERKRADRAVGLLRELFENGPCDVMIGGNPITVDALQDQINELLATQSTSRTGEG